VTLLQTFADPGPRLRPWRQAQLFEEIGNKRRRTRRGPLAEVGRLISEDARSAASSATRIVDRCTKTLLAARVRESCNSLDPSTRASHRPRTISTEMGKPSFELDPRASSLAWALTGRLPRWTSDVR